MSSYEFSYLHFQVKDIIERYVSLHCGIKVFQVAKRVLLSSSLNNGLLQIQSDVSLRRHNASGINNEMRRPKNSIT